MPFFEKVKGAPAVPVPAEPPKAAPIVQSTEKKFVEGAAVELPDAGPSVYKDRAGLKLGGGPAEGVSYAGEIARQARLSVEAAELAELAELEKATRPVVKR